MRLIKDLGLSSKVTHISFSGHIAKHLSNSHIYLQGSYVEGFPNALLESCSVGTPVVVFKALGGINEIVENGVNGFIVNNEEEFINKIEYIYNSFDEWIPRRVSKSVHEKYNSTKIMKDYEKLFLEKL